jgi:tetratricopeptide (TPR) repeat protein
LRPSQPKLLEDYLYLSPRKLIAAWVLVLPAVMCCAAQTPDSRQQSSSSQDSSQTKSAQTRKTSPVAAAAQNPTRASLDVSETLFSIVAAINVCGYDQELASSSPIRKEVRADLVEASELPGAAEAANRMCLFYRDHKQSDSAHDLAQYVSLALNVGGPPDFAPKWAEADMPPDAAYVLGFVPLLKNYAAATKLHSIWLKRAPEYDALIRQFHDPVSNMITATDTYLRMPLSGTGNRSYTVYLEPMAAPGQVNSRDYRDEFYYMVVSPEGNDIHMEQLRHAYLHFVLDPLIARRATALDRIKPILASVQHAPMAEEYKEDIGLLVIESLIRAVEVRTPLDRKLPDKDRLAAVQRDETEGFVLTSYFYEQLRTFEKENVGLQTAFPDWLHNMDVDGLKKQASQVQFASTAEPELMRSPKAASQSKVDQAERALASGNPTGAAQLAQDALNANEDPARAYFVLARVATLDGNMQDARDNFSKALQTTKDPRIAAWCHIYLGRILDLQEDREDALVQYKAALGTGDVSADTKAAAERGLKAPYEPPADKAQRQSQPE